MSATDEIAKIVKSIKPIDVKTEIKNPSFAPVINYKSPTNNNYTFNSIEVDNRQLNVIANNITNKVLEELKTRAVGTIATNNKLQDQVSGLPKNQLKGYMETALAGTATVSQFQPDFQESGATLFPNPESIFKLGFEMGSKGKQINNVKIIKNPDNTITIQYDEN